MKYIRFIYKHKVGLIELVLFLLSSLLFILFVTDKSLPKYESLSEISDLRYLWLATIVLTLGISNSMAIYTAYRKYQSKTYVGLISLSNLILLSGVVLLLVSDLMSGIYVPEPPLNADTSILYQYFLDRMEVSEQANHYHSLSRGLILVGVLVTLFSSSILNKNGIKYNDYNDDKSTEDQIIEV